MAHYAQIDETNTVLRVIVVSNDVEAVGATLEDQEALGRAWLAVFAPTAGQTFFKTSYNGSMRKNYAGIGFTYDASRDAFIPPKPSEDAILDEAVCDWVMPSP